MVTRKPLPGDRAAIEPSAPPSPPYPTTPIEPSTLYSPTKRPDRRDSEGSSIATHGTWDDSDDEHHEDKDDGFVEVPPPLKIRPHSQDMQSKKDVPPAGGIMQAGLPAALIPGPVVEQVNGGSGSGSGSGSGRGSGNPNGNGKGNIDGNTNGSPLALESNNPYKSKPVEGNKNTTGMSTESTQSAWNQTTMSQPPLLPIVRTPAEELSNMSLQDHTIISSTGSYMAAAVPPVPQKGMQPFSPVVPVVPAYSGQSSDAQAFPSTNPWSASEGQSHASPDLPPKDPLPLAVAPTPTNHPPHPSDDQLVPLHEPQQPQLTPPTSAFAPAPPQSQPPLGPPPASASHDEEAPSITSHDVARNELYQVKHIRWYDASSQSMRNSPILTQNANGPCPLLALVNAIVLSTPGNINTPLVEALSDNGNRSQISLGLLLDALFDELTSCRRGEGAEGLPDMTQMYAFLLALHTGMNVNPRFVSPNIGNNAGTFEDTREMRLYSTLNIPLMHGWTPPPSSPPHTAFSRSAQTFEEAQNIQFLESDLTALPQLDAQQKLLLDDIHTIKAFLSAWPTQLTEHGLEALSSSIKPGQVVILFRNDHFSTMYKEPKNGALMTLVTDAGYSSHEEIVWESLVDVNGAASEMFSGDFRVVSHGTQTERSRRNEAGGLGQWEEAQRRYRQEQGVVAGNDAVAPPLPGPRPTDTATFTAASALEQEDHDLALALQLQEEEEDAQRQAEERRRRQQELSDRFLSAHEAPPAIPPRRGSGRRASSGAAATVRGGGRPPVSRPPRANADADAPPTYEESRTDRVVRPGQHPSQPPPSSSTQHSNGPEWGGFGSPQNSGRGRGRGRGGGGRGGGKVGGAANVKDAEDKCVLM